MMFQIKLFFIFQEVLVPYAEDNLKTFLESHFEDAQKSIDALRSKVRHWTIFFFVNIHVFII